ncbi:alpha/beta fold hydrolase [Methylonatrum kenyense]|uniref:alpha/beta fold hydrolase n=1 Tax=Methylonatrum kenyense TaxID=455253 RepID=UPI0020C12D02|nr:alpha/beta fold hydrolase [Methylonatrum kenyense]MCK8516191.1 alpha/beta fold hydrolase [Methylonatrum kenyense]
MTFIGPEMLQALRRCSARQPVRRDATPFDTVLRQLPFSLRRYHLPEQEPGGTPLLLVYSTVNRPDLLDLSPRRSMVRRLLEAGHDVYLVDWGRPLAADTLLDLDDYVDDFLGRVVRWLRHRNGGQPLNAIGVCQGGIFLSCYAALYPEAIGRLVNMAVPLNPPACGHGLGHLAATWQPTTAADGNIPGPALSAAFTALKPTDLLIRRYSNLPEITGNDEALDDFLHLEAWMYDCPDQPAALFNQFVEEIYQRGALLAGELRIAERQVDLSAIQARVLSVIADADHLVPPAVTRGLEHLLPAERYSNHCLPGGHLGLFTGGRQGRAAVARILDWLA